MDLFVFGTGDSATGHRLAGLIAAPTQIGANYIRKCLQDEVGQLGTGVLKRITALDAVTPDTLTLIKDELNELGSIEKLQAVRAPGAKPTNYLPDDDMSSVLGSMNIKTTKFRPEIRIQRRS